MYLATEMSVLGLPLLQDDCRSKQPPYKQFMPHLTSKAGERIRDVITCPICQETYQDPVVLLCGDSFCRKCIEQLVIGDCVHQIKCPLCEKCFNYQGAFVPNLQLAQLIGVGKIDIRTNSQCAVCKQLPSITCCPHCEQLCCTMCINQHQEDLKEEIKIMTKKMSDEIVSVKESIRDRREQFEVYLEQARQSSLARVDSLKAQLEHVCNQMHNSMIHFVVSKQREASASIVKINKELERVEDLIESATRLLNGRHGGSVSMTQLLKIESTLQEPRKILPSLTNKIEIDLPVIKFVPSTMEVCDSLVGQYAISRSHRNVLRLLEVVGEKGAKKGQFRYPCSLHINWLGQLVVCDRDNGRIQIIGLEDDSPRVRQIIGLNMPHDVCCDMSAQTYLITDEHRFAVIDEEFKSVFVLGDRTTGRDNDHLNAPWGICTDKDCVYIADSGNDRIVVLDVKTYAWNREIPLNVGASPNYLCTDQDKLVYSSIANRHVIILSKAGQVLLSFPKANSIISSIGPMNVRIYEGYIFVADSLG